MSSVSPAMVTQAVKTTTTIPAAAAAAAGISSKHKRVLLKLRSELARHLSAVAQVTDEGQYLQETTRVMRERQEVEDLNKREAEVSGGALYFSWNRFPCLVLGRFQPRHGRSLAFAPT